MTEQIVRATLYDAPPVTPIKGTLLDVATIHEGMTWLGGTEMFSTFNCLDMYALGDFCYPGDNTPAPFTKDLDQTVDWPASSAPFGVYGGVTCRPVGFDGFEDLKTAFQIKEHMGVEKAVMQYLGQQMGGSNPSTAAVSPKVALAMLENDAACSYTGAPTIHMSRVMASLLTESARLNLEGNALRTALGSKVAAGGGYGCPNQAPDGTDSAAGTEWMYASGEIVLWRGEMVAHQELNRNNNDMIALVERGWVVAVDCYVTAVKVTVQ